VKGIQGTLPFVIVLPFILNLIFNIAYTPIQFGLKNTVLASIDIVLILGTLVWLLIAIFPILHWVTFMNLPYFLWVSFATVLQFTITYLNR
jgi:benzodiazapine receptor